MRTPLTGILGALDLISKPISPKPSANTSRRRTAPAMRCYPSSATFSISRASKPRCELELETTGHRRDRRRTFWRSSANLPPSAATSFTSISIGRLPTHLTGDAARIRQVLLNLVTNAVKFTYNGTIAISVTKLAERRRPCRGGVRRPRHRPRHFRSVTEESCFRASRNSTLRPEPSGRQWAGPRHFEPSGGP